METGFDTIFRMADSVGNLYETKDYSDRVYGAGSCLEKSCIDLKERRNKYQGGYGRLATKGREYFYDEEGNLAKKDRTKWRHMGVFLLWKRYAPRGNQTRWRLWHHQ